MIGVRCRLLALFLGLVPGLASAATGGSCVRSISYLDGELTLGPSERASYAIEVGDTMYDARISMWLEVTRGERREVGCSLFEEGVGPDTYVLDDPGLGVRDDSESHSDLGFDVDNSNQRSFRVERAGRVREQRCPTTGTCVATLWNPSSRTGSRTVRGFLRLSWLHDPKRAAADRMKAKVRFVGLPRESTAVLELESGVGIRRLTVGRGADSDTRSFSVERGPNDHSSPVRFEYGADSGPEIGIVDFDGDGDQEILLVGTFGGSGGTETRLVLLVPSKAALVDPSVRAHRKRYPREVAYLESLKVAYQESFDDFVEAGDDDPRFTSQKWLRDNGGIDNGRMKLRKYPGFPADWWQGSDTVEVDGVHYMTHFKSGVDAYDPRSDENFVVFDPGDPYDWSDELSQVGPCVIIFLESGSIAIVDTRTYHLYRLTREDARGNHSDAFTFVDGTLLVRGMPIDELMARKSRRHQ